MTDGGSSLAREFRGDVRDVEGLVPRRCESREAKVRMVEYAPFPRVRRDQCWRVGFTRDLSATGMCLRAERTEPVGSLLRVVVRSVEGRPTHDSVAQVVCSCRARLGCAFSLGVELVAPRRPARDSAALEQS